MGSTIILRSTIDISTLETWLLSAANTIRGASDAPKFKDFILPLIFYKRLSDVFDDEFAKQITEFGDEQLARQIIAADHENALALYTRFPCHIIVKYKAGGFLLNLISVKVSISKVVVQRTPMNEKSLSTYCAMEIVRCWPSIISNVPSSRSAQYITFNGNPFKIESKVLIFFRPAGCYRHFEKTPKQKPPLGLVVGQTGEIRNIAY